MQSGLSVVQEYFSILFLTKSVDENIESEGENHSCKEEKQGKDKVEFVAESEDTRLEELQSCEKTDED